MKALINRFRAWRENSRLAREAQAAEFLRYYAEKYPQVCRGSFLDPKP